MSGSQEAPRRRGSHARALRLPERGEPQRPNAAPPGSKAPTLLGEFMLLLMKVAFVAVFAGMVLVFLFGIMQQGDESMMPAMREGDLTVYYRLQKDYSAGDLIVVNDGERKEVRRVVAVAGDTVDFNEDGLVVNGYHQSEDRIYAETLPFADGIAYPVTIAEGQVFVMGDDRPRSKDSRLYGPVDVDTGTEGEVMTVIRRRNF